MSVKIRLKRLGKVRVPQYRIVIVDSRKKRDGKVIEEIGKYHPKEDPSYISVVPDRAAYWLGVGAQPSEAVAKLLKITGDWQKFKGLKGTDGTLKTAAAKRDKLDIFNEALAEAHGTSSGDATTKKTAAKKAAPKADEAKADEPKAEKPKAEPKAKKAAEPKAEEVAADAAATESAEPAEAPAAEATPVPADETPEGAAANAEDAETAQVDADKADS